jgi:protein-tyrosine phosphatase
VTKAGWQDRFVIDSAGTGDWHIGNGPDPRSVATAQARGVDIASLRARQLHIDDFRNFRHLIALDETHFDHMMHLKPQGVSAQISLLMQHDPAGKWRDVPDPYYGGQKDFDLAYDLIARGVDGLLATLMKE